MPDITPDIDSARNKYLLADAAYKLHDNALGKKYFKTIDSYITDQLDYNYALLEDKQPRLNVQDIQLSLQLLNAMADTAKTNNDPQLSAQLSGKFKDYSNKFGMLQMR